MQVKVLSSEVLKTVEKDSVIEVSDEVGKQLIADGQVIEYTKEVEEQEKEVIIKQEVKEIKMSEIVEKEGKIEVKAPAIQKKSMGETLQMMTKAVTGLNETDNAAGGYLTYTEIFKDIVSVAIPGGVIYNDTTKITLGDRATGINIPYDLNTGNTATSVPRSYAVAEGAQKTITIPQFGQIPLALKKQVIRIAVTDEILQDVDILENWFKNKAREKMAWTLDELVFNGVYATNGFVGITHTGADNFRALATVAATMTKASIINLIAGVLPQYRAGSKFYMSNKAWASMMDLSTTASNVTPFGAMVDVSGKTLMGYPVVVAEQLANLNSNGDIIFGNPSTYVVAIKGGMREFMDASLRFDYNEMNYILEFRASGAPTIRKQTLVDSSVVAGFSARF